MPLVRIRISVSGFTEAEVSGGLAHLLAEFRERPWMIRPTASWDPARTRLVVTTHYEGDDADYFARAASDEVWDCVIACIDSSGTLRFDLEESAVIPDANPPA